MNMNAKFSLSLILAPLAVVLASPAMAQCNPPDNPPAQQEAPKARTMTIPAGTSLLIRMISKVDSSKNRVGDYFHASLETSLRVDDVVLAPKGADVYGKLAKAKDAGKISGAPELTL